MLRCRIWYAHKSPPPQKKKKKKKIVIVVLFKCILHLEYVHVRCIGICYTLSRFHEELAQKSSDKHSVGAQTDVVFDMFVVLRHRTGAQ